MAFAQQQPKNWGSFINPQYNRLQNQIQQETQALLRQRQSIGGGGNNFIIQQPYLKPVESQSYLKLNSDRSHYSQQPQPPINNSRTNVNDKVKELMQLCRKQNIAIGGELMKVLNEEKNIYGDMLSNGESSQKTQYFGVTSPIMQAQKESSVYHGERGQQQQQQQQMGSNFTSSGSHSPQHFSSNTASNTAIKPSFRQTLQNNPSKLQLGDDLIQMIEQIESKALNEIQKLRQQKIDLMKQLKQQIQANNQLQKEVNTISQQARSQQSMNRPSENVSTTTNNRSEQQLPGANFALQDQVLKQIRQEMDYLRKENQNLRSLTEKTLPQQQPMYTQSYPNTNINQVNALRQRVAVLQGELRSRDDMIKELYMEVTRLNQQGGMSNNYQITSLLQQGENIRQHTLQLIRLKQAPQSSYQQFSGYNESQRIRQLQELLEKQEQEKQTFLNDLLVFKQKYQQLEEENRQLKRQSKFGSSDIARFSPITEKSYNNIASIDDYERLYNQMKNVARY